MIKAKVSKPAGASAFQFAITRALSFRAQPISRSIGSVNSRLSPGQREISRSSKFSGAPDPCGYQDGFERPVRLLRDFRINVDPHDVRHGKLQAALQISHCIVGFPE
jgi:hypothetical protein